MRTTTMHDDWKQVSRAAILIICISLPFTALLIQLPGRAPARIPFEGHGAVEATHTMHTASQPVKYPRLFALGNNTRYQNLAQFT